MAKSGRRKPMSEINVVPYIDVMLVLLVIFMVTAPLMTQGIKVDLPKAYSESMDADENALIVTIKQDGSYYLNTGEEEKTVTLKQIGERSSKIIAANPDIKVLVEGDRNLKYGSVIELMTVLQNAGARSVGLITEPPNK
ncbi:MAG: protein TolR [Gammaproteobacteria bacterium]|nr:protein TolR [Gammaproteobacteria bacterium]